MKNVALSVLLVSLLAACAQQEVKPPVAPVVDQPFVERKVEPQPQPQPMPPAPKAEINPLKDPNNILSKRSVYYDFDKYDVKDEFKPLIGAHAGYLTGHTAATIAVQGNCDERGSREYNVALGHRRADSVRKMMNALGVADKQIEAVSFGEDKPRANCHDESCWKENRRSDIVYSGE